MSNPHDQDIARRRLASHQLTESRLASAADVVRWLGGVQAQDYAGAKWSIGLRLPGGTDSDVEQAIADHRLIRTWAMRGTLHFVAAEDIYWLLALLSPTIIAGNARRYRQLELDDVTFARSNQVIAEALGDGGQLTRDPKNAQRFWGALTRKELVAALAQAGISADGQRAPYLLQRAALEGVICLGPNRGREPTYVSLEEWASEGKKLTRDEALAELAARYFASHGPATVQDFTWWSGLPAGDARAGLEAAKPTLVQETIDRQPYWTAHTTSGSSPGAHLLPAFDDYLLGYKERSAALDPQYLKKVNAGGGMPKPTVLLDGRVAGVWNRTTSSGKSTVTVAPFAPLSVDEQHGVSGAVEQLGAFLQLPISLSMDGF